MHDPRRSPVGSRQIRAGKPPSTRCSSAPRRYGPMRWAISDPLDRETFTDGAPHRLTFADADRIVFRHCGAGLRKLGLQTDAVVGIQLPKHRRMRADHPWGVIRAGHDRGPAAAIVAARRHDPRRSTSSAPRRSSRRRVSAISIIANWPCRSQRNVFPIRYVCGLRRRPGRRRRAVRRSDGRGTRASPLPRVTRSGNPAAPCRAGNLRCHARRANCKLRATTPSSLPAAGDRASLKAVLDRTPVLLALLLDDVVRRPVVVGDAVAPGRRATLSLHHAFSAENIGSAMPPSTAATPVADAGGARAAPRGCGPAQPSRSEKRASRRSGARPSG